MRVLKKIRPTPEQLKILVDDGPGFRQISGAAGSGKTTTALLRLQQLCNSRLNRRQRLGLRAPVKVLCLTFNRTLQGYIGELVKQEVKRGDGLELTVKTFAQWAVRVSNYREEIIKDDSWKQKSISKAGVSGSNLRYFENEVDYILGRFKPEERKKYLVAERSGRGRAPQVRQEMRRKLLEEVIEPYESRKRERGVIDWNDLPLRAINKPCVGYDVVVVDEAQDFSNNQIRAILRHLAKDHTTTFVMDSVQRIYSHQITWSEVGIRIDRGYKLENNYRNTREIAQFAAGLIRDLEIDSSGTIPSVEACRRSGHSPIVVVGTNRQQLEFMLNSVESRIEAGEAVGILYMNEGALPKIAKRELLDRGIAFCELTGQSKWPAGPELVALCTIHSAKGLEFDHVLLPGLDHSVTPHGDEDGDGELEALRRLVAMGIGRARNSVMLGYRAGNRSTLFDYMVEGTYTIQSI